MLETLFVVVPFGCGTFVLGICFLICFKFSNHHDKEESWLLCPFLKVQWVHQESVIVTIPCLLCLCARLFICALGSPAWKALTSWLSFVVSTMSLSFSNWYPGSGVVFDCIDS